MHPDGDGALSVATSEFDEVVATMRDVFGKVEIRRDDDRDVMLRMRSSTASGVRLTRWGMSGCCSGDLDLIEDDGPSVLAGLAIAGDVGVHGASGVLDTGQPYLCPERFDFRFTRVDIVNVAVDQPLLEAHAAAVIGSDSLTVRFAGTAPLDDLKARAWQDTVVYASRVLDLLPDQPGNALIRAAAVDAMCSVLLQTFPNTVLSTAAHGSRRPNAAVQRAVAYVDERLADAIHPADLARAAGMSLRGLHAAFRRELGTTPMVYIRDERLSAARRQLQQLDPTTVDLDVLARQWGFASARRFSTRYTELHGEAPADTLRH
ncbi:helix-turn-helix domain-containing protein [Amnibacterium kyonggiense]